MIARKDNKEYTVDKYSKDAYLNDGYDIYENGKVVAYSPKKQVSLGEYEELDAQVKELTAKLEEVSKSSNDKELVKANKALEKQVKELTAVNEELDAQVKELTAKLGDSND